MIQVIELMNSVIDICLRCNEAGACYWLRLMRESGESLKEGAEEFHGLTRDEIAGITYSNVPQPYCQDQYSFDMLMNRVEDIISKASFPSTGAELSLYIQKLQAVEKRLIRLPSDVQDTFDAEVLAVSERALSAIDYYYLCNGVDLSDALIHLYPQYNRQPLLEHYYNSAVVSALQKRATSISFDDIMDANRIINKAVKTEGAEKLNSNENNNTSENVNTSKDSGKFIEIEERASYSPLQTITDILCNKSTCDFVAAITMTLGFRPANYHEEYEYYVKHNFISSSLSNHLTFIFTDYEGLYNELFEEIGKRKNDEHSLLLYMSEILSPFQEIAPLVYPIPRDVESGLLAMSLGYAYKYGEYSLEKYSEVIAEAYSRVTSNKYNNPSDYIQEFSSLLNNELFDDKEFSEDGILSGYHDILNLFRFLQLYIEAALLLNGTAHDYRYYEEQVSVSLGVGVQDFLVARLTNRTPAFIRRLADKYGHRLAGGVKPDDDLDSYVERLLKNPHDTVITGYDIETPAEKHDISGHPELLAAVGEGIIAKDGRIITNRADFIRFCYKNKYFEGWGRKHFRPIDKLLIDKKGHPITAAQLAQSYSDLLGTNKGTDRE